MAVTDVIIRIFFENRRSIRKFESVNQVYEILNMIIGCNIFPNVTDKIGRIPVWLHDTPDSFVFVVCGGLFGMVLILFWGRGEVGIFCKQTRFVNEIILVL